MRVDIIYETNDDAEFCLCARAEVRGFSYFGIGKDKDQAKANLLKKLNAKFGKTPPPPETVDIEVADEEMDTEFELFASREIEAGKV